MRCSACGKKKYITRGARECERLLLDSRTMRSRKQSKRLKVQMHTAQQRDHETSFFFFFEFFFFFRVVCVCGCVCSGKKKDVKNKYRGNRSGEIFFLSYSKKKKNKKSTHRSEPRKPWSLFFVHLYCPSLSLSGPCSYSPCPPAFFLSPTPTLPNFFGRQQIQI